MRARLALRLASVLAAGAVLLGPLAIAGSAAGPLNMNARVLLQGHARGGSWTAIEVDLQNDGPPITGELRMDGGSESNARYAMAVKLPTNSHQTYVLHAQPPAFGRNVTIDLVADDGRELESVSVAYLVHDATQLVVGVLAEQPGALISQMHLPSSTRGLEPAVFPLTIGDLPSRVEGWSALDRLVWQDLDSNNLTPEQLEAMRRWIAAGGRLVIVGGSAGIGTLSAFPDDILPYRPTATVDAAPEAFASILGSAPDGAADVPAMVGALARGRALATAGDRAIAAELGYGAGRVTILGFDPTSSWIGEDKAVESLWRSVLPARTSDGTLLIDDSQILNAVYQLPALALPPTEGLLGIIGAYILIIGPINYLILKRLDRRELAWITMPVLVLGFTAAAFGYGALLKGTDVVVNEVAIVHGAPDATEATAQVYFGVFSPTRATYRVEVPGGALLASPISGDPFGQGSTTLDIVQGTGEEESSAIRNLSVGTGSIRIVRAQVPVSAPRMRADLHLVDRSLTGTFENASEEPLENVAVVLGSSVAVLGDVPPGESRDVRLTIRDNPFGASLADQVIGAAFDNDTPAAVRRSIRYQLVNQLTFDPTGMSNGSLSLDQAVIMAFGQKQTLDVKLGSETPRQTGNVLYYVPVEIGIAGHVAFSSDLMRSTVVEADGQFSKDRFFLNLGNGSATLAYQPIPFEGTFSASGLRLGLISGGGGLGELGKGKDIEPLAETTIVCTDSNNTLPKGCQARREDFLPEVEVFDRSGEGRWLRLPRMSSDTVYNLLNPQRYADPATGQVLMRFVNDNPELQAGFGFQLVLEGDVE
ncbi:MAG TPA: hypothetical protein VFP56_12015 [Candidatus Limnocylindrales bacterium]|nr:hypothetical protein [Candidatus Limnocylindrales bacterium]